MAISGSTNDLENKKFEESPASSGLPAVRVKVIEAPAQTVDFTDVITELQLLLAELQDINVDTDGLALEATLSAINAKLNSLGQKTSANSVPVVLSSDQSAVPITDNGGSLTVDGTVSLSGTSAVNVAQMNGVTVAMNAGNSSAGTQRVVVATDQAVIPVSDNGGSLTVDGTVALSGTSSVNLAQVAGTTTATGNGVVGSGVQRVAIASDNSAIEVKGDLTAGSAASGTNPVLICGQNVFGNLTVPTMLAAGPFNLIAVINADTLANVRSYKSTGEAFSLIGSTDNTKANAAYLLIDSAQRANIAGQVAHDDAYAGNPLGTGGYATSDPFALSSVAAADMARLLTDLKGLLLNRNYSAQKEFTTELAPIITTYNNVTTTATSDAINAEGYRFCTVIGQASESGTATDFQIEVLEGDSSGSVFIAREDGWIGQWVYTDNAIAANGRICGMFRIGGGQIKFKVTATGTDASNTFTIGGFVVRLST